MYFYMVSFSGPERDTSIPRRGWTRKKVYWTFVKSVRWESRSSVFTEHLLKVVIFRGEFTKMQGSGSGWLA